MDGIQEVKKLITEQGETFEAFKATNDRMEAEIKKLGSADALTIEQLAKIDDRLNVLMEAKQAIDLRADAIEKRMNRPGFGMEGASGDPEKELKAFNIALGSAAALKGQPKPADLDEGGYADYKKALNAFLRKNHLDDAERKALSVGSDPDGGQLVTADMSGRIVARIYETSPIRAIAAVQPISTDALEGMFDNDEAATGGWVGETATRSETTTPQIGSWRIPTAEQYAEPRATQKLLDDAAIDVEAWLGRKVADKMSRYENAAFITADGANDKPRGFTKYTTAATSDANRTWGQMEHVGTGNAGDFASSNPADILFDLIGAFKDHYLANGRWVTRREVITKIRKFKESTTNAYMWQPGLQAGQPQTLLGFPVTIAMDMPALASGSLSLAFGDFREGYQIVDRQGIRVLRDPYTAKPYVKFYTTKRVGGAVVNFEAIKFVKFS